MAVHRVTRILPYAPQQLADLVADVRAYPDFVPWVTSMRVWNERAESEGVTVVDLVGRGRHPHQSALRRWSRDDDRAVAEALALTDEVGLPREAGELRLAHRDASLDELGHHADPPLTNFAGGRLPSSVAWMGHALLYRLNTG